MSIFPTYLTPPLPLVVQNKCGNIKGKHWPQVKHIPPFFFIVKYNFSGCVCWDFPQIGEECKKSKGGDCITFVSHDSWCSCIHPHSTQSHAHPTITHFQMARTTGTVKVKGHFSYLPDPVECPPHDRRSWPIHEQPRVHDPQSKASLSLSSI